MVGQELRMRTQFRACAKINSVRELIHLGFRYVVILKYDVMGEHGSLNHWNGQRMSLQQGVSHTSLEWTDGNSRAGSFPYFGDKAYSKMDRWMSFQQGASHTSVEWTDGDAWAGSFPYFRWMKPSMQSQMVYPYHPSLIQKP